MFKHIYAVIDKIKSYLSEKGQGMVEYALILAFIAAVAAIALSGNNGLGDKIKGAFIKAGSQIESTANQ